MGKRLALEYLHDILECMPSIKMSELRSLSCLTNGNQERLVNN